MANVIQVARFLDRGKSRLLNRINMSSEAFTSTQNGTSFTPAKKELEREVERLHQLNAQPKPDIDQSAL